MRGILLIIIVLLIGSLLFLPPRTNQTIQTEDIISQTNKETNFTANFKIVTSGTTRDFSNPMYHNLSEDVYITAENINRVVVNKEGTTWNDFFKTLPMSLTTSCLVTGTKQTFCTGDSGTLRFYSNSIETPDLLETQIRENESILVEFSKN